MLAGIVERLDRGLRTQEDVRLALGLPVLAAIPLVSGRRRNPARRCDRRIDRRGHRRVRVALAWRLLST
jgi:hypothetical protein